MAKILLPLGMMQAVELDDTEGVDGGDGESRRIADDEESETETYCCISVSSGTHHIDTKK